MMIFGILAVVDLVAVYIALALCQAAKRGDK